MSWAECEFESLYQVPSRNGVYKAKQFHGSGVPIVNMGELFAYERISGQPMKMIQMSDDELGKSGLADGDLLFGRRSLVEEGAGKCSIVDLPTSTMTFESSIIRVRLDAARSNPMFYFYYFRSPQGRARIKAIVNGTSVKGIRGSDLKRVRVVAPEKALQDDIVECLKNYDDLILANQRRIQLLEELVRNLYREWFVHLRFPGHEQLPVVDGVPEGWERKTFKGVCLAVGGGTPSTKRPEYWGGDITWVTPTDVTKNDSLFLSESDRTITEMGLENSSAKLLPPEAVLMTSRASIGYFAIPDRPVCTNQGFISIVPIEGGSRMYLLSNLRERVDEMLGLATGATFKELSKTKFNAMDILWPESTILGEFCERVELLFAQMKNMAIQNDLLKQARDQLLPKLMSGQLDINSLVATMNKEAE